MALQKTEKIWRNGKLIAWDDAQIHVLSHVVSYASAVFEGVRCYHTAQGPAIFRLREHMRRLVNSAYIYRMQVPFTVDELCQASLDTVLANKLDACYIRPIVLRGYGDVGVDPTGCPVDVYFACWEWGKYLGDEAMKSGVDVCVSSWNRSAPNTLPQMAKAAANYMNSQLIKMEAKTNGYSEGIALDTNGHVSEGSGENIFVVKEWLAWSRRRLEYSALPGITRNPDCTLVPRSGYSRRRASNPPRDALYRGRNFLLRHRCRSHSPIRSAIRN